MIIKPKFRDFICVTAHPEGCKENVLEQINYAEKCKSPNRFKKVLIIGASTGYGLSSRIVSAFGYKASTIGIVFEKQASRNRTATAGWYNTAAFEEKALEKGYYSRTINGDAFSKEIKQKTINLIKKDLGKVDLVIYSIASPRRKDPATGKTYYSFLKPVGKAYKNKTVNFHTFEVSNIEIQPATDDEINQTVNVMGGQDWKLWIDELVEADVLSKGVTTIAYSYIGPEITYPIYRQGTIGKAKEDLEEASLQLDNKLKRINGKAFVSVNKALVTQSSSAIPVVPLYVSVLDKVMKQKGIDESCIEQIDRLFSKISKDDFELDEANRIRLDDMEMREDVQEEVRDTWNKITTENIKELTNIESFRKDFFKLFGFEHKNINYEKDTHAEVNITNIIE
ncbi:enoyl-ACP reductase FabV [Clostridium sp.]|jgi:enoyl-[acyl-carrier protein] reductase/trans-2-enoyl-CoA reductase (NAD+)|uniref:enoyl-ACP reductase FabV n=1 Tax=Clostridium sp. TaxID=1506 RepID=UPI002590509B|nr:enoyl-ACP reductase FabV [Clostridium sp.]MDF2505113.1 putative paraquat-inducible protein [Clostridium sp.]